MSDYVGIHVNRLQDGTIESVQVRDPNGYELPLPPDEYRRRDIKPPIEELPDANMLQTGELIHILKLVPEDADISGVFKLAPQTLAITAGEAIKQCEGHEPGTVVRANSSNGSLVFGPDVEPYVVVPQSDAQ